MNVVVIGEALVDIVERPGGVTTTTPGGSPLNVAVGLGRLGHAVEFTSAVAKDPNGAVIIEHLHSSGVSLRNDRPPFRSSSAIATIQEDGSARYVFDLTWDLSPVQLPASARFVHTGSLGAAVPPGDRRALDALRTARTDSFTTFDPNVRPALMRPHALQVPLTEQYFESADIVKLSDEDAAWIYPGWSHGRVMDRLFELGVAVVAMTCGADGALVATREHCVALATNAPAVVDTIGAGDSFMAGLIHAVSEIIGDVDLTTLERATLLDSQSIERVGLFAQACAAVTVSRLGANLPWRTELPPV